MKRLKLILLLLSIQYFAFSQSNIVVKDLTAKGNGIIYNDLTIRNGRLFLKNYSFPLSNGATGSVLTANASTGLVSWQIGSDTSYVSTLGGIVYGNLSAKRFYGFGGNNLFGTHTGDSLQGASTGNNFIGVGAGAKVKIGNHNNLLGTATCSILIQGDYNNAIGFNALASLKIGNSNTAIGLFSGALLDTSSNNLFLGDYSGMHLLKINNMIILNTKNNATASKDTLLAPIVIHQYDSTYNTTIKLNGVTTIKENLVGSKDFTYDYTNYSGRGTGLTYTPNLVLNTAFRLALVLTSIKATNIAYTGDTALVIGKGGNYIISLRTGLTATAAGETYKIAIYKNNVAITTANPMCTSTGASYYFNLNWDWDLQGLLFGDIITFKMFNSTNSNDPTFKEVFLHAYKKPE